MTSARHQGPLAIPHAVVLACAESLAELTQDLLSGAYYDKERAVSMLSGLTLYIDYHDALLASDVLPALMQTVCSETVEPTVRLGRGLGASSRL